MRLFGSILLATFVASSFGAEVIRVGRDQQSIAVTHSGNRQWKTDDRVCIYHGATRVVCGTILKTTPKGAIAKLETPSPDVLAGDEARFGGNRRPTALLTTHETGSEARVFRANISGGLSFSYNFFFPMLDAQFALGPSFAIGVMPLYFRASTADSQLGAFGGFVSLNYYGAEYFRGLWGMMGAGAFFFNVDNGFDPPQSATSPAFILTGGWRGYWDLGLNIGVAAGIQYVNKPTFTNVDIKSAGIQPLLIVDVGFNF
jgi:hypothetical protein